MSTWRKYPHNSNYYGRRYNVDNDIFGNYRGSDNYSNHSSYNKRAKFKTNYCEGFQFRKNWNSKTTLVREQLDNTFINYKKQFRNSYDQRLFFKQNYNYGSYKNFRKISRNLQESSSGWYHIIVSNAEDCDETLKIIQTHISPVVFHAYNKKYAKNVLKFVVDDFEVAKKLSINSYKIVIKRKQRLIIKVESYLPSRYCISFTPVSDCIKEKMVEAMMIRYNSNTKSLDLSQFHTCQMFTKNQLFVPLNQPAILLAALNIVAQYTNHDLYGLSLENNNIYLSEGLIWIRRLFPELKVLDLSGNKLINIKDLQSLSGYTIEVLNLSRNPLCDTKDMTYKLSVQKLFPVLKKLDDSELPSRYTAIVDYKLKMPINLNNSYPVPVGYNSEQPNPVITLVESFLTQYYERYDNTSKQMLAEAYHKNAIFSLSSCFIPPNHFKGNLTSYLSESRNFFNVERKKNMRNFYRGKVNIIKFLEKLPHTKHDTGSFIVDVPVVNSAMIQIVVNGVFVENFKEKEYNWEVQSFCRAFSIVPVLNGWSIISDMLFVTVASDELLLESSKRFSFIKSNSNSSKININSVNDNVVMCVEDSNETRFISSNQLPAISNKTSLLYQQTTFPYQLSPISDADKLILIQNFSNESGMNEEWSKKCLEENLYDCAKAALSFLKLKSKIPPIAFKTN